MHGEKDQIIVQESRVGKNRGVDGRRAYTGPIYGGNSFVLQAEMRVGNIIQKYGKDPGTGGAGKIGMEQCYVGEGPQTIAQKQKILAAFRSYGRNIGMCSQPTRYARHPLIDERSIEGCAVAIQFKEGCLARF